MRIATITPGVRDTVIELGLGDWVVCAPDKPGWHPAEATPHATIAPNAPLGLIDISSLSRSGSASRSFWDGFVDGRQALCQMAWTVSVSL